MQMQINPLWGIGCDDANGYIPAVTRSQRAHARSIRSGPRRQDYRVGCERAEPLPGLCNQRLEQRARVGGDRLRFEEKRIDRGFASADDGSHSNQISYNYRNTPLT